MGNYKIQILGADYITNDNSKIRLFGKTKKNESIAVIIPYDPYFIAVPKKPSKKLKGKLEKIEDPEVVRIEEIKKIVNGKERDCYKVFTKTPADKKKVRDEIYNILDKDEIDCYEYSINFYKRFFIDEDITPTGWIGLEGEDVSNNYDWSFDSVIESDIDNIESIENGESDLKILAFDTESYEEGKENRLSLLSVYGEKKKKVLTRIKGDFPKYVETVKSEKEILERFIEIVEEEDPDILVSYNGDDWDFSILREVAERTKTKLVLSRDGTRMKFSRRMRSSAARINGRVHLDLIKFVRGILSYHLETETYNLNSVASEILDEGKEDFQYGEIITLSVKPLVTINI